MPHTARHIPGFDYGPYQRLRESTQRQITGAQTQATLGTQAALSTTGVGDIPGVQAGIAGRQAFQFGQQQTQAGAQIDIAAARGKEAHERWAAELRFRMQQYRDAKTQDERDRLILGITTLIKAGATIAGALIGGPPGAVAGYAATSGIESTIQRV